MTHRQWIAFALAAAGTMLAGCSEHRQEGNPRMDEASLRKDLEVIAAHRVFFGHQSVGVDIVQGLKDLKKAAGVDGLVLVTLDRDTTVPQGAWFADALVGRNSEPDSKCDMFGSVVKSLAAESLDVALMKFCYVDIKKHTDVQEMFRYYTTTMDDLKAKYPGVTFVHVTVPVTERTSGWRRFIKKVLGREDEWDIASLKRTEFNDMLLKRYQGEPVFDLAAIESTYPDGSRSRFEANGKEAFTLVGEYTRDGGHLNETGRKLVARELIRALAGFLRGRPA